MRIGSLDTVLPNDIPSDAVLADWVRSHGQSSVSLLFNQSFRGQSGNVAMAETLRFTLDDLPTAGEIIQNPQGQPDDLAHDAYFHVRRLKHDEATVFLRAILAARLIFLREVAEEAVTTSHTDLTLIDRGFADLSSCLFKGKLNAAPYVTEWHSAGETCSAMQRWVHGHLVFAALTQGLILSFRSLGQALRAGRKEDVQKWADLSISLLRASGAAFVFTGDFPPGEYENSIRPSMTPPQSPIGLSGLMSADHRYLAQTIRDIRPVLKALADAEPDRHDQIAEAVANVYDRHIFVCERFVGPRPSILTAGRTERSGPSLIDQFKTLRLKPFEHPQRASRLAAPITLGECPHKR